MDNVNQQCHTPLMPMQVNIPLKNPVVIDVKILDREN